MLQVCGVLVINLVVDLGDISRLGGVIDVNRLAAPVVVGVTAHRVVNGSPVGDIVIVGIRHGCPEHGTGHGSESGGRGTGCSLGGLIVVIRHFRLRCVLRNVLRLLGALHGANDTGEVNRLIVFIHIPVTALGTYINLYG